MTGLPVNEGSIFYCELRRRTEFEFDEDIRTETIELANEAHRLIASGKVPEAEENHNCKSCSLMDFCQPNIGNQKKLKDYYQELFG